ncbi:MAG: hypothetical protein R3213_10820, partial [Flavobacteriaceae bacterium]|nr:hypothetical protein [Flavobacteriaceae bacterium]
MMKKENNNNQNPGFKVPNGYFDSIEERVLGRIEQQNPLNSIKNSGFTVPDNYFSTVQDKIVNRAYPTVTSKPKIFTLKRLIYVSGIAASILLLIKLANISESNFSIDNLQTTSIEEYILEEDINEYELA